MTESKDSIEGKLLSNQEMARLRDIVARKGLELAGMSPFTDEHEIKEQEIMSTAVGLTRNVGGASRRTSSHSEVNRQSLRYEGIANANYPQDDSHLRY